MDMPEEPSPTGVDLDRQSGLTVRWADGTETVFGLEELRVNCPCAECRGVREQGEPAWPRPGAPQPLAATGAELVGAWGHLVPLERPARDRHLRVGAAPELGGGSRQGVALRRGVPLAVPQPVVHERLDDLAGLRVGEVEALSAVASE